MRSLNNKLSLKRNGIQKMYDVAQGFGIDEAKLASIADRPLNELIGSLYGLDIPDDEVKQIYDALNN